VASREGASLPRVKAGSNGPLQLVAQHVLACSRSATTEEFDWPRCKPKGES
jgi:hypothetical protein